MGVWIPLVQAAEMERFMSPQIALADLEQGFYLLLEKSTV